MVKLVETNKVSKANVKAFEGQDYVLVPAIGDGNCAFNGFALGLIDLIKRDQLKEKELQALLTALQQEDALDALKQRHALYQKESADDKAHYTDLADDLKRFIDFLKKSHTVNDFKDYVIQQTKREAIAALHVGFAPALRFLSAKVVDPNFLAQGEQEKLVQDGYWLGEEALQPLAKQFQINLYFHTKRGQTIEYVINQDSPSLHLYSEPGHWDYLYPVSQTSGLDKDLTPVAIKQDADMADENATLMLIAKQQENDVSLLSQVMQQVADNLLAIQDKQKQAIEAVALQSTNLTQAVCSSLNLKNLQLKPYEEALFIEENLANMGDGDDHDAKLARVLQNAEILSFLNSHYDVLTGSRAEHDDKPVANLERKPRL